MSELLEIRWDAALENDLARWLLHRGQMPALTAGDMATQDMVTRAMMRRTSEAAQAVRELRTVLESRRVPVHDLDVMKRVLDLQDRRREGGA
mgnify:CR=1 FL=1